MHIQLRELSPYHYTASNQTGQQISLVATPELSGQAPGFRPTELLPTALAACSAIDLRLILDKQRQQLDSLEVTTDCTRDETQIPSLFTHIHLVYLLQGQIDQAKASRALDLALQKYCTLYRHLAPTINITRSLWVNGEECPQAD